MALTNRQIVLHELSEQDASLEEAFMELTKDSVQFHANLDIPKPSLKEDVPA